MDILYGYRHMARRLSSQAEAHASTNKEWEPVACYPTEIANTAHA